MNKKKGELLLLIAAIFGGCGFICIKYLLDGGFGPFWLIAVRFLIGGVMLFAIYGKAIKRTTKEELKAGILLGSLLFLLFTFLTVGLRFTTPSVSAFLGNAQAIIAPFLCWLIYKNKPDGYCFTAAVVTLIGVLLLSLGSDFTIGLGAVLSLFASATFALQMTLLEKVAKTCDPIRLALLEHLTVAVLSVSAAVLFEDPMPSIDAFFALNFAFLGIFCTGIYFLLQCIGQKYTSASTTAIIITSESVFGAITSAVIYGERLPFRGYIGCILIFLSIIVAVKKPVLRLPNYRLDGK